LHSFFNQLRRAATDGSTPPTLNFNEIHQRAFQAFVKILSAGPSISTQFQNKFGKPTGPPLQTSRKAETLGKDTLSGRLSAV